MLKLSGITKSYDGLPVLSDLSLTLSPGEIVALIGPSGCGKTTLLNLISGLATPDTGTIEATDTRLSYMFQSPRLLPWRTVEENIRLVREDAEPEAVRTLISDVGLKGFEGYYPTQLSGGMARRVLVSTALITGFTAKESVVSTLTVLLGGNTALLPTLFTPFTALVFLVFTLLYTPCVAAIATVRRETGSARAAALTALTQCAIAWVIAFLVRCLGGLLGLV